MRVRMLMSRKSRIALDTILPTVDKNTKDHYMRRVLRDVLDE